MRSTNYAYVNRQFVPESEATVSIFDRGFLYGDGVFETMRVYGGKVFMSQPHLQRLANGLQQLAIKLTSSAESLEPVVNRLIDRNQVQDGVARIYVTRGRSEIGLSTKTSAEPTVLILAQPRTFDSDPAGLRAIVSSVRIDADSLLTRIKSANRLPYVMAKAEADRVGVDEAVLLNGADRVVEFSAANLFAVKDDELFTPPLADGALPGITRRVVLGLAEESQIPAHEKGFGTDFLAEVDEIFATNSVIEVCPVTALGERTLPGHEITNCLRDAYRKLVRGQQTVLFS